MTHIPPKHYIDRDSVAKALLTVFSDTEHGDSHFINGIITAVDFILDYPTEKVEEVRHGEWEETKSGLEKCSICGKKGFGDWLYYPRCGAKMKKEK